VVLLLLCALPVLPAAASETSTTPRRVLIVFAPVRERTLLRSGALSLGIMSAAQGEYSTTQLLLDMSQGARVSTALYPSARPPALAVRPHGGGALVEGWPAARERARAAPAVLEPGLLASSVPGAAAFAGMIAGRHSDALLAADRDGHIAALSLGSPQTLLVRVSALLSTHALVVADLPAGRRGHIDLAALAARRPAGELLIVIQRTLRDERSDALLWAAAGGLPGGSGRELSSPTTREAGLISATDVAPTALSALRVPVPVPMAGHRLETRAILHPAALRRLMARLHLIGYRRLRALAALLLAWAVLLLAGAALGPRERAAAMRIGALAVLWSPVAVLLPAALSPPEQQVEYALIVATCLLLAATSDALLRWPRAPLLPGVAAIVALTADQLAGTQLLLRSLLGPDPILGARFYGIGNELKSGLAVLALAAVAAALYPARRGPRAAGAMAAAGVLLAVLEGAARLGAGVGGVVLVCFGFALAAALLLPGAITRKRALAVLLAPVAGLLALAAIDIATAHGGGHYTGSILHARSAGDVRELLVRRYTAAWQELRNHAMPVAFAVALVAAAFAWRARRLLLAPVDGDPAFTAALAGGIAAGTVGALTEDSGPLLLVVAVFVLGCVGAYLWGRPPTRELHAATVRGALQAAAGTGDRSAAASTMSPS
jgi:hypothetical protein